MAQYEDPMGHLRVEFDFYDLQSSGTDVSFLLRADRRYMTHFAGIRVHFLIRSIAAAY
jgi:hypothetical protein